jgi:protein-S-isoprenylcysteine O-methyltransferase Ste14
MTPYLIFAYFLLYFAIAFVGRSLWVWHKTGVNPYHLGTADNAHDFAGRVFRFLIISSFIVVISYTFFPAFYALYFTPLSWLKHPFWLASGATLLVGSLVWITLAQLHMGHSWRIGIDEQTPAELVQTGLFAWSRNPIFLGMRLNLLGFFLVMPNAFSLAIWLLGDVVIQMQVRLEEQFLRQQYGVQYENYCQKTGRWLLKI